MDQKLEKMIGWMLKLKKFGLVEHSVWIIKHKESKVKSDGFKQNKKSQKAGDGCAS